MVCQKTSLVDPNPRLVSEGNRIGVNRNKGEGMVCQPIRIALLIGAITAMAVSPARANHNNSCSNSCAPACSTPSTRTIMVRECVPETYTQKVTRYKVECRQEEYTYTKCEVVPECRERVVTYTKRVPVTTWETRKVCKNVTEYENRVVTKKVWKTVEETQMKRRLVSLGHWECKEVKPLFGGGLFGGHGCNSSCGNSCDPCATNCAPVRTRKVWVYCPQYECCPVTVCKRVCVEEPCCVKVAVCKQVWCEEKVQVCKYECVNEQRTEKYTVCVTRQVPCKGVRTVRVCVPYEETVTCTRYVTRCVAKEVPVCQNACPAPCQTSCSTACSTSCCEKDKGCGLGGRLRGLFSSRCDKDCGGCR